MMVGYKEGQIVPKGYLLAVIDPRPYEAALLQAQGQLARDQALLANAKLDRGALPDPGRAGFHRQTTYMIPRSTWCISMKVPSS